jgi:hypothetical protein
MKQTVKSAEALADFLRRHEPATRRLSRQGELGARFDEASDMIDDELKPRLAALQPKLVPQDATELQQLLDDDRRIERELAALMRRHNGRRNENFCARIAGHVRSNTHVDPARKTVVVLGHEHVRVIANAVKKRHPAMVLYQTRHVGYPTS